MSDANDDLFLTGLSVSGNGEYVVGNNTTAAFQWKNGVQKNISLNGYINDIVVK
ncbi:hypothetical protein [Pedobacter foliorum]|uniref:hypothetical protein n=1 Tax=Pedobacter foliorum TaxID=2739058 RepID=UPI0015657FD1|nr:hypothetical protein [Pedobacter foliorum]NRF37671.1 hypothetical protein [Pedobacter foliorum]